MQTSLFGHLIAAGFLLMAKQALAFFFTCASVVYLEVYFFTFSLATFAFGRCYCIFPAQDGCSYNSHFCIVIFRRSDWSMKCLYGQLGVCWHYLCVYTNVLYVDSVSVVSQRQILLTFFLEVCVCWTTESSGSMQDEIPIQSHVMIVISSFPFFSFLLCEMWSVDFSGSDCEDSNFYTMCASCFSHVWSIFVYTYVIGCEGLLTHSMTALKLTVFA